MSQVQHDDLGRVTWETLGYTKRVCQCGCGKEFMAKRRDAKYYDGSCRKRVKRRKDVW